MKVLVVVTLKKGIADPVGKDLESKLKSYGLGGALVSTGKIFELEVDASNRQRAHRIVIEAAEKLLTNPVIETFEVRFPRKKRR